MPTEMPATPVVKIITDKATGRLIALTETEEFDLFMRRTDPLYAATANYCQSIGADARQRALILLNAMSDQSRKMRHALIKHVEDAGAPAFSFEVLPDGQLKNVDSFDRRLRLIQMVEQIEHHVRNDQKESALLVANNLRNQLTR